MRQTLERCRSAGRQQLQPGQYSRLIKVDVRTSKVTEILRSDDLIESPNWSPDDEFLVVNSSGKLYRIGLKDGSTRLIDTMSIQNCNNDHILSPDGQRVYFSAAGHLYVVPVQGGEPRKLSNDIGKPGEYTYWLHGVSPDEKWLAYVTVEPKGADPRGRRYCALLPTAGGKDVPIMDRDIIADGPEYSPDGRWIYFNAEIEPKRPGHSQIFRMDARGGNIQQLTFDEEVNWFPHLSPDGKSCVYLAYERGTESHPADVDVRIMLMDAEGGNLRELIRLFGGQGSLNVNSWSPDGKFIATVEYPAKTNTE